MNPHQTQPAPTPPTDRPPAVCAAPDDYTPREGDVLDTFTGLRKLVWSMSAEHVYVACTGHSVDVMRIDEFVRLVRIWGWTPVLRGADE